MRRAIYAGSFDPITLGHEDIILRASSLCDSLYVGVGTNSSKKSLFDSKQRISLIQESISCLGLTNVFVFEFSGLLIDFCRTHNANIIVRGLRALTDFEYELGLAAANRTQAEDIQTIFLPTLPALTYVSSSYARELARLNGKLAQFVSPHVESALRNAIR